EWQRGGDGRKAFDYTDRVAELRLRQFENASAITQSEAFLKLAEEESISAPPQRLAAANFVLGEAQVNLGRMEAARTSFENGLRLLRLPMPRTRFGLALSMVRQTAEHLIRSRRSPGHRESVERWRTSSVEPNNPVLKAARAYELLTQIYYFRGDRLRIIHATLRATNLAEHAKLAPVLAVQYSNLGAICGVVPLRKRAERYLGFANELTKQLGMPTVDAKVSLLSGLYWTSIGEWQKAKSLFEPAPGQALPLGGR